MMLNVRYLPLVLFFTLSVSCAEAQQLDVVKPERVGLSSKQLLNTDRVIQDAIDSAYMPGAVLAVVRRGQLAYLKAYGKQSVSSDASPMTVNTIFDVASCTKSLVTSLCVMKLIEQGYITLNDNIDMFIPDFNKGKRYKGKKAVITVKNLLTHTSGLMSYISIDKLKENCDTLSRASLIDYVKRTERNALPDSVFQYSCINYILLQEIIEKVAACGLDEFADKYIIDALGLTQSGYIPVDEEGSAIACKWDVNNIAPTSYMINSAGDSVMCRGVVHDPLARVINRGVSGNAGFFSSARDVAVLANTLLREGEYGGNRILSPLAVRAMFAVPQSLKKHGRTLGWDSYSTFSSAKGDLLDASSLLHTGFTGSSIVLNREEDLAIIFLTNYINEPNHDLNQMIRIRKQVANTIAAALIY